MSGHSKWSQIKHKKALTDAKKGKIFSKLARQITLATKEKDGDPEKNAALRLMIEKARSFNMPQENIERAIKRGTGEIEGVKIEEFLLEVYGPGGVALLIKGATDNKNRTLSEIKNLLTQHQGKIAESGSVSWLFERCGVINISLPDNQKNKDKLEMQAIEGGAQDIKWLDAENLEIYTKPEELEKTKKYLERADVKISEAGLGWKAKNGISAPDEKISEQAQKLFEALDENEDVNEIYSNLKG